MKIARRLIVWGIAALIVCLWCLTFTSAEWTIRRTILESLQPINSLKANIVKTEVVDAKYGNLYAVEGYMNRATGDELGVVYVKKRGAIWVVSSKGTGP
ncbi:hypothetical protein FHS16_004219 [Paenibacillus endophyticus]|uniref:Uncharacterized protein n=1 Tax=Paenibacillus endophyticus TaxID=1294268 RepID=A0A7W5CAF8_9BACL|nr:hypothetical protein [Paenibacillus endophyticus]MBB3154143.1 hypothetical protein [Paenibacillus endophyticus]